MEKTLVLIVGAGPAGLALAACLTKKSIPFILLEREDCHNSLWKKRAYDRCHLHLAKEFCSLPFKPHEDNAKKYMSKNDFINYVDDYVDHFGIKPRYHHSVEHASFDEVQGKWEIRAMDTLSNVSRVFFSTFLVVATGENGKGVIPDINGVKEFEGDILHSSQYKSGLEYCDKDVLVVGCGNSGMEISLDLANHGANTSIVVRNSFHVVTKDMIWAGMNLMKYFSIKVVDVLISMASNIEFGNLSKYGIHRPDKGPFFLKATTGRSPVIDVGTVAKIREGKIKVRPGISRINKNSVVFQDQIESHFDAIVFATGYKSTVCEWLKDYEYLLKENGFPKNRFPNHWKGKNRLYCAGLARMGLQGVSRDAHAIATDIQATLRSMAYEES
ncbi:putative indole-3-pyruvate monooxygenase YUCCA10 [Silene latifolia]|uniref:putative indole-3-pyruvate monooxygenase YUCCA10 n=1 Tax=Silene latifolia TaxID=37657 RepID=UPI003D787635